MRDKILILGGTFEAAAEARRLTAAGAEVITSLAGRLADPPSLPGRVRVGGFGGTEGLQAFIRAEAITWVIDATHPFAAVISRHAQHACQAQGVPLVRLDRPPWAKHPGDRWHWADDAAMAARLTPHLGRRALLTVGAGTLGAFARAGGPFYLVRLVAPPGRLPFPHYQVVIGRGPFALADEIALMRDFRIDLLVSKASGGQATEAKIAAARTLKIPVLLLRRPAQGVAG
ncbi:cobalt-precorrin-6A reductase [Telmatospirillum sp.]|uniref:cobalt-precorrin-6A reductase n=1 Tax=Telmatospirillum sp. TaxID=2079197 RepID=UPI00283D6546|nr:cobalt-precorrin-6A reductase [Telmatospirillum sp.]MDR3437555.1 cobalt-precorrin-6A reductase [Telmatospirillum sp.]